MRRVSLGPVSGIPEDECVAAGDGRAVVVRVGDEVLAYRNRCLHQDAPLAGGWVRDGVLSCPLHFWRYDVATGCPRDGNRCLERFEVVAEVIDGTRVAVLLLPDEAPPRSLREELLERARTYDRSQAFDRERTDRRERPPLR